MRFSAAVDEYVADMHAEGRFNSALTERSYRHTLSLHAEDVGNRDPAKTGREDAVRTLRRWSASPASSVKPFMRAAFACGASILARRRGPRAAAPR